MVELDRTNEVNRSEARSLYNELAKLIFTTSSGFFVVIVTFSDIQNLISEAILFMAASLFSFFVALLSSFMVLFYLPLSMISDLENNDNEYEEIIKRFNTFSIAMLISFIFAIANLGLSGIFSLPDNVFLDKNSGSWQLVDIIPYLSFILLLIILTVIISPTLKYISSGYWKIATQILIKFILFLGLLLNLILTLVTGIEIGTNFRFIGLSALVIITVFLLIDLIFHRRELKEAIKNVREIQKDFFSSSFKKIGAFDLDFLKNILYVGFNVSWIIIVFLSLYAIFLF